MEEVFLTQNIVAFNYIVMIPVLVWYIIHVNNWRLLIFGIIFIINFSRGTLELIGVSSTLTRLIIEFLLVLLVFITLLSKNKLKFTGIKYHFGLLVICITSIIINNINLSVMLGFFRDYWTFLLFFFILINTKFKEGDVKLLNRLLIYMCIAQIFASFIKYFIVGMVEPYIGTISVLGGAITTTVTLLGLTYGYIMYLFKNKYIYIAISIGFCIFGVIGGKRAIIVFVPLMLVIISILFFIYNEKRIRNMLRNIVMVIILLPIFVYTIARTIPSFNPDNKIWGKFNLEYTLNYTEEYSIGSNDVAGSGRATTPGLVFALLSKSPIENQLFGFGAGHLVRSSLNKSLFNKNVFEVTQNRYGNDIGYGANTGFLQILLEIGYFGLIIYVITLFQMYKLSIKYYKDKKNTFYKLLSTSSFIVLFIIFFMYSTSSIVFIPMGMIFAWIFATSYRFYYINSVT